MSGLQLFRVTLSVFFFVLFTKNANCNNNLNESASAVTDSSSTNGIFLSQTSTSSTKSRYEAGSVSYLPGDENKEEVNVTQPLLSSTVNQTLYNNYISNHSLSSSQSERKCTQTNSTELNKCLHQLLQDLRPRLGRGIPEINLPALEPLRLENVEFDQGTGAVKLISHFTNVEVSGLSNFSQSEFWVDVPKRSMDFDLIFPQLSLVGVYELSGNLFYIPIGGSGNFYLNLGGTRAKGVSKLSVFRNATVAQVVVEKTNVNLEIDTIKVHLTNLFNGDPLLGTFINKFLNENSQEVFTEVKPQIRAQVGKMLSLLANRALSALSTSQFDEVPFSSSSEEDDTQQP